MVRFFFEIDMKPTLHAVVDNLPDFVSLTQSRSPTDHDVVLVKTADNFPRAGKTLKHAVFHLASIKLNHVPSCRQLSADYLGFGEFSRFPVARRPESSILFAGFRFSEPPMKATSP